jgi:CRISPR/Cas system-associated endoribonuclease Cas2
MKVLNFDLSTTCVGVIAAGIDDNTHDVILVKSCSIVPEEFDVSTLGYMKSKKKLPNSLCTKSYNSWVFKGEKTISETEKEKRDVQVREARNLFLLTYISERMRDIIDTVVPSLINAEQNSMFNGMLTIELLAKLMGTLVGLAADRNIPIEMHKVQVARKRHNPAKLVAEFARNHDPGYIKSLPDVTKAALRQLMQEKYEKYGLKMNTDDEGDACVVFDYWYEEIYKSGISNKRS